MDLSEKGGLFQCHL